MHVTQAGGTRETTANVTAPPAAAAKGGSGWNIQFEGYAVQSSVQAGVPGLKAPA